MCSAAAPGYVLAPVPRGAGETRPRLFGFGDLLRLRSRELLYGGTTTKNERARESLEVIGERNPRRGAERLGDEELEKGKKYLIGSYPLRFDTSTKIAWQLVHIQLEGREPDWLVERNRADRRGDDGERAPRRPSRLRRRLAAYDGGGEARGVLTRTRRERLRHSQKAGPRCPSRRAWPLSQSQEWFAPCHLLPISEKTHTRAVLSKPTETPIPSPSPAKLIQARPS